LYFVEFNRIIKAITTLDQKIEAMWKRCGSDVEAFGWDLSGWRLMAWCDGVLGIQGY